MDNIKKYIMWAVGVIVTVIIIVICLNFFYKSKSVNKAADKKYSSLSQSLSASDLSDYDGTTVDGSDAISCIKTYASSNLVIKVSTGTGAGTKTVTSYTSASYNVTDNTAADYIEPTAKFDADLVKASNGNVKEIDFVQQ